MIDFKQKHASFWLNRVQPRLQGFISAYWEKGLRNIGMFPRLADTSLKSHSISFATDVPLAMNVFSAVLTYLSLASVNHAGQRDSSCLRESWKESSLRKPRARKLINHAQSFIWKQKCVESQQWESVFSCPAQEAGYCALQILKHRHTFFI